MEWMPERDQEMQENGQPERVMSKVNRRGSQDRAWGGGRIWRPDQGPRPGVGVGGVRRRRGKGLPSGSVPQRSWGSAQGGTEQGPHRQPGSSRRLVSPWKLERDGARHRGQLGDKA